MPSVRIKADPDKQRRVAPLSRVRRKVAEVMEKIRGYDPRGHFVFETQRILTQEQCKRMKEYFLERGFENVMIVHGGRFKPDEHHFVSSYVIYTLLAVFVGICFGLVLGR